MAVDTGSESHAEEAWIAFEEWSVAGILFGDATDVLQTSGYDPLVASAQVVYL